MKNTLIHYASLITAFLALAGVAFFVYSRPVESQALTSEHFLPEHDNLEAILAKIKVFGFAGTPKTRDDSLAVALDLYGNADYAASQKSLAGYLAAYPDDHTARFYLGMTHLYLQAPQEAFRILTPLSELKGFEMQDDARWYAALAAAGIDQMRALGLFSALAKDPGSKYSQAAEAVMTSVLKTPGKFSFHIESGDMLQCSLVIASTNAWWQAGWARALIALLFPAGGASLLFWRNKVKQLEKNNQQLGAEMERSEALLLNILPADTAEELKKYGHSESRRFEEVTVLFCDFKDFTKISETLSPEELVASLNECFAAYDRIVEVQNLEKIKTVGDCYICVGGLTGVGGQDTADGKATEDALQVIRAAQQILAFLADFNERQAAAGKPVFEARIGIHTGAVVAGIVGIKKFAYDIWGDTVNIAARMEQSGEGGRINISGYTYEMVKNRFTCQYRGKVDAKGKGAVDMYFVG